MSAKSVDGDTIQKTRNRSRIVDYEPNFDVEDCHLVEDEPPSAPDGGYGWVVTFGSWLSILLMGGMLFCCLTSTTGIMQDHYEREIFGNSSWVKLQLATVGTLVTVTMYLFAAPTGILYSVLGAKIPLYAGTLMASGGLVGASAATKIWHLYLSMSVCTGIGVSIISNVYLRVLPFWFDKKRNIAFGIYGSAQPFAGLVIPFIMTPINRALGAQWTFRILAFAFLVINIIACIIVKEAPAGIQTRKSSKKSKFNFRIFFETNLLLWICQGPIQIGCLLIIFTFIPSYATHIGLSDTQGSAIISVTCAMGFVGRISIGFLADRLGRLNTLILTTTIAGLTCLLIWMLAYSFGTLMTFALIYGFSSGGYNTLCATVTAFLVGLDRYSMVISVVATSCALSSLGNTIASAIESVSTEEPFLTYKLMTGLGYIFSAVLLLILKIRIDKNIYSKI